MGSTGDPNVQGAPQLGQGRSPHGQPQLGHAAITATSFHVRGSASEAWENACTHHHSPAVVDARPVGVGVWFRVRVKEINGIELDPAQPLPSAPEVTLDWRV